MPGNPYLDDLNEDEQAAQVTPTPAAPPPAENPYATDLEAELPGEHAYQQREELVGAAMRDTRLPIERRAAILELAGRSRLPADVVERNFDRLAPAYLAAPQDPQAWVRANPDLADLAEAVGSLAPIVVKDDNASWFRRQLRAFEAVSHVWLKERAQEGWWFAPESFKSVDVAKEMKTFGQAMGTLPPKQEAFVDDPESRRIREAGFFAQQQAAFEQGLKQNEISEVGIRLMAADAAGLETWDLEKRLVDLKNEALPRDFGGGELSRFFQDGMQVTASSAQMFKRGGAGAALGAAGGAGVAFALGQPEAAAPFAMKGASLGFSWGATAGSFEMETGQAYLQLRDAKTDTGDPIPREIAIGGAVLYGLLAAGVERWSFGAAAESLGPVAQAFNQGQGVRAILAAAKQDGFASVLRRMAVGWAKRSADEGAEEFTQHLLQDWTDWGSRSLAAGATQSYDPVRSYAGAIDEAYGAMASSLGGGAVQSGAAAAGTYAVRRATRDARSSLAAQVIRDTAEQRSVATIASLTELAKGPLAQASAEEAAAYVEKTTEGQGEKVTEVFIDPAPVLQLLQSENLQPAAALGDAVAKDLETAVATGVKASIPVGQYIGLIRDEKLGKILSQHASTRPTYASVAERKQNEKDLEERTQALLKAYDADEKKPESKTERELMDVLQHELVRTGVHKEGEAKHLVNLVRAGLRTMSERAGVDPNKAFELFRVRVEKAGAAALDASSTEATIEQPRLEVIAGQNDNPKAAVPSSLQELRRRLAEQLIAHQTGSTAFVAGQGTKRLIPSQALRLSQPDVYSRPDLLRQLAQLSKELAENPDTPEILRAAHRRQEQLYTDALARDTSSLVDTGWDMRLGNVAKALRQLKVSETTLEVARGPVAKLTQAGLLRQARRLEGFVEDFNRDHPETVGYLAELDLQALKAEVDRLREERGGQLPPGPIFFQDEKQDTTYQVVKKAFDDADAPRVVNGKIVGAPTGRVSQRHLVATVEKVLKAMQDPLAVMDQSMWWYEDAGAEIRRLTPDDLELREKMVRLLAFFSAASEVKGNVTAAIKAVYQLARGEAPAAGRWVNTNRERLPVVLDLSKEFGQAEMKGQGISDKIESFYRNLHDPAFQENRWPKVSTQDRWMMRFYGYPERDAALLGAGGASSLSPTQYTYAQFVTRVAADLWTARTGQKLLPRQVQAVLWTFEKNSTDRAKLKPAKRASFEPQTFGFHDALRQATANITFETFPSTTAVPGLQLRPMQARSLHDRALSLFIDSNGHDQLLQRLIGSDVVLRAQLEGRGAYQGGVNITQIAQLTLDKVDGELLQEVADSYADALGFMFRQDAVPWHRADPAGKTDGVVLRTHRPILEADQKRLLDHLNASLGRTDLGFTQVGNEVRVLNFTGFSDAPMAEDAFAEAVIAAVEQWEYAEQHVRAGRFRAQSEYRDNDWKADPNGEGYARRLAAAGRSDLLGWLGDRRAEYDAIVASYRRDPAAAAGVRAEPAAPLEPGAAGPRLTQAPPQSEEFRRWFVGSVMTDARGEPAVLYHGTRSGSRIEALRPSTGGEFGPGIYLARRPETADFYATSVAHGPDGPSVLPLYASIKNPYRVEKTAWIKLTERSTPSQVVKRLRKKGYDGIIGVGLTGEEQVVAWDAEQVRSAFAPALEQQKPDGPRAFMQRGTAGLYRVAFTENADRSSFLHEAAHVFLDVMGELAARESAKPQLKRDYAAVLEAIGFGTEEQRRAAMDEAAAIQLKAASERRELSDEERARVQELTAPHEQFARWFEQYAFEGRAPSPRLRRAFHAFKEWMKRVYADISALGTPLNDEVRDIFDRMLASDAEIERARRDMGGEPGPVPKDVLTKKERKRYEKLLRQAKAQAKDRTERALLADRLREHEDWWRVAERKMRNQVRAEWKLRQPVRVRDFLRGILRHPDGTEVKGPRIRFDRAAVRRLVARDVATQIPTSKSGVSPDEVAQMFGYADPRAMLEELAALPDREQWVRTEARRRMRDRHPDLARERDELAAVAQRNLHSKASAAALEMRLEGLRRLAGPFAAGAAERNAPVGAIARAGRRIAERQRLGDLRKTTYLRGQKDAARRAARAEKAKDWITAARFTQIQLLNFYAHQHTLELRREMDVAKRYVGAKRKAAYLAQLAQASPSYLVLWDAVRAASGLGPPLEGGAQVVAEIGAALAELERRAAANASPLDFDPDDLRRLLSSRPAWDGMTLAEARLARDALQNIRAMAVGELQVRLGERKEAVDSFAARLVAGMQHLPFLGKERVIKGRRGQLGSTADRIVGFHGKLIDPELLFEVLGPAGKEIFQRYLDRKTFKHQLVARVLAPWVELTQKMPPELMATRHDIVPGLETELPYPPDLNLDEQAPRTYLWLMMVALNAGNESNLERLTGGFGWTQEQVFAALDKHLTRAHWDFIQSIWDLFDKDLWPEIAAKEARKNGVAPTKIQAREITTRWGVYRGGYFPARYNPVAAAGEIGERQVEDSIAGLYGVPGSYQRAHVPHSFTKERAAQYRNVMLLDWSVVPSHIAQVIHDVAFDEFVRDTGRIIFHPAVKAALYQRLGKERANDVRDWLRHVATQQTVANLEGMKEFMQAQGWLRSRMVAAAIGHSLTVALADFTNAGVAASLGAKLGGIHPVYGTRAWFAASPLAPTWSKWRRFALERSAELKNRVALDDNEHLLKYLTRVGRDQSGWNQLMEDLSATNWFLFRQTDKMAATQIWLARFWQEVDAGVDEGLASTRADEAVRATLPGAEPSEKPALLRNPHSGVLLVFFSYFAKLYNMLYGRIGGAGVRAVTAAGRGEISYLRAGLQIAELAGKSLAMVTWVSIGDLFSGRGPEPDEDWQEWLARKALAGYLAPLPFGVMAEPIIRGVLSGQPASMLDVSPRAAPAVSVIGAWGKTILRVAQEGAEPEDYALGALEAMLYYYRLPVAQPRRTFGYLRDVVAGDAYVDDAGDMASGVIYGERQNQPLNPITAVEDLAR